MSVLKKRETRDPPHLIPLIIPSSVVRELITICVPPLDWTTPCFFCLRCFYFLHPMSTIPGVHSFTFLTFSFPRPLMSSGELTVKSMVFPNSFFFRSCVCHTPLPARHLAIPIRQQEYLTAAVGYASPITDTAQRLYTRGSVVVAGRSADHSQDSMIEDEDGQPKLED